MEHLSPHHGLKLLPDLEDFELKKGYMRALIEFAESGVIDNNDSDAESVRSRNHGQDDTALGAQKTYISCRMSSVPVFTWAEDQAAQEGSGGDVETGALDNDSILSASTAQSPGPTQETFGSLHLTKSRERDLPTFSGLSPPPHPQRKTSSNLSSLRTVQEEPPKRSLSATNSPVLANPSSVAPTSGFLSVQGPQTIVGRPSTSTTPSSSSLSAFSNISGSRRKSLSRKRSSSPRRSGESLFRLFRPTSTKDETVTFLERRTLTPHERLAPIPLQQYTADPSIPPVPVIADSYRWEAVPVPVPSPCEQATGPERPVFGIPLDESVALAPMRIRVSHKGSSVSYRSVPLSIYKCCEFIRQTAPHPPNLFSPSTLEPLALSTLYTTFNTAPSYGSSFSFVPPTPHDAIVKPHDEPPTPADAAHLILLYLRSLPKPLIPHSVLKSWIMLSRRYESYPPATSMSTPRKPRGGLMEEASGLDFWAEALNRLGTMERNLVKLLLEVFSVVLGPEAGAMEEHGLAVDVAGGMLHLGGEEEEGRGLLKRMGSRKGKQKGRDAVVALGFLVRRRGEYLRGLTGDGGGEGGFLPSVGDMKAWKGR